MDGGQGSNVDPDFAAQWLELASVTAGEADFDVAMESLCDRTRRLVRCDRANLFLREGERYVPRFGASSSEGGARNFEGDGVASDSPLIGRLSETRQDATLNDAANDPLMDTGLAERSGTQSIVIAPVFDPSGQLCGLLTAERGVGQSPFAAAESVLVRAIAHLASVPIERREAHAKREAMEARLATVANLEPISRFAGTVAQDFSNRLTVIIGLAEMMTEQSRGTDIEADLEELMRSAEAAAMLTQRLLEISSGRADGVGRCNLSVVANESHGILRRLVPSDVDLSVTVLENDLPVGLGPHEFERILSNLVMNAADACEPEDSIEVRLRSVELFEDHPERWPELLSGRYACASVHDSGVGIDPPDLERIFEPFFSRRRNGVGTGFGLATVYGLVHAAGGAISAESRAGEGSVFTILLPIDLAADAEDLERRPDPVLTDQRATILLVEDNESVRSFVRGILVQTGHRVLEAANGRHALEVVDRTREPIHLLVTDVVMPDLGGSALAAELEKHIPDLQVLFISGYAPGFRGDQVAKSPDRAFLPKPFSAARLLEAVDARLARLRHLN